MSGALGGFMLGRPVVVTKRWPVVMAHFNGDTRVVVAAAPELREAEKPLFDLLAGNVCRKMPLRLTRPEGGPDLDTYYLRPVCTAQPVNCGQGHVVCMVPPGRHNAPVEAREREPWQKPDLDGTEDTERGEWTPRVGDVVCMLAIELGEMPTTVDLIDHVFGQLRGLSQGAERDAVLEIGRELERRLGGLEKKIERLARAVAPTPRRRRS